MEILVSDSINIQQLSSTSQKINIQAHNSVIMCGNIQFKNLSTLNMFCFSALSTNVKAELNSALQAYVTQSFSETIDIMSEGANADEGEKVISDFKSKVENYSFMTLVNNLEAYFQQFVESEQDITVTLENVLLGGPKCSYLIFCNEMIMNLGILNLISQTMDLAMESLNYSETITTYALDIDKVYTQPPPVDAPETGFGGFFRIILIIVVVIIIFIIIIIVIKSISSNKNKGEHSNVENNSEYMGFDDLAKSGAQVASMAKYVI
jgi:hypothetical protein